MLYCTVNIEHNLKEVLFDLFTNTNCAIICYFLLPSFSEPVNTFVVTEPIKPPTPFADLDPRQQFDGQKSTPVTNELHVHPPKQSPSKGIQ